MSILDVTNLTFSYENEKLLIDINMRLFKRDHAVLVGPNGSGKSTILKLINGLLAPDSGAVTWTSVSKVGYLDQYLTLPEHMEVSEYLYDVYAYLFTLEKEMEGLYEAVATAHENEYERLLNRATKIGEQLEEAGFYILEAKINNVLIGLGLEKEVLSMPFKHLSGGMRAKVILAKLLLEEADVLLLDEPTNFLDVSHIEWLTKFLKNYQKAFIVISHDEKFLKDIATVVFALEGTTVNRYKGDYNYYLSERLVRVDYQTKTYENQQKLIEKTEDFIRRNIVRASTTKLAQSRRKMLEKMPRIEKPRQNRTYKFSFPLAGGTGKEVLKVTDLVIGYKEPLLDPINLVVERGDKVVITGKNGIGKSTFLKTIIKEIPTLDGSFSWIDTAKIAYLPQDSHFAEGETPFSAVSNYYPHFTRKDVMKLLSEYGIDYDMALRTLNSLSGGERTKVRLALLKHQKGNVLIMDEPTNHLDVAAKEALLDALLKYEGTLLLVSHERAFYEPLCDYELALFDEESE